MEKITIALDWTPNINHVGFFVAEEKGFYDELGLEVEIIDPSVDNYAVTPAKKVELGQADFALCPMESIISFQTKAEPFSLVAGAAIFKEDLSAIVSLKDSGINSPKQLDGKKYASYQARYEDEIVRQMIKNDGGEGTISVKYPEKLGIWNTLLNNETDATWIFLNWEGIHAAEKGVALNSFQMKNYQVPYSYSPVIALDKNKIADKKEVYQNFLQATKKGFLDAKEFPLEAVGILSQHIAESDEDIDLKECLDYSVPAMGDESNWGIMEEENVAVYLKWIYNHQLESQKLSVADLITNELLH